MKVGVAAAGSVVASTALISGTPAGLSLSQLPFGHAERNIALAADSVPTYDQSLEALLQAFGITNTTTIPDLIAQDLGNPTMGTLLGYLGTDASTGDAFGADSSLSDLLTAMNFNSMTLGQIFTSVGLNPADTVAQQLAAWNLDTLSLSSILGISQTQTLGGLIDQFGLGATSVDTMLGWVGLNGQTDTVQQIADELGLGSYTGLLCGPVPLICTGLDGVTPTSTLDQALSSWLGIGGSQDLDTILKDLPLAGGGTLYSENFFQLLGLQPDETLGGLIEGIQVGGSSLGSESISDILTSLGLDPAAGLGTFIDGLQVGGADLGSQTLGELLGGVTDATTLATFLGSDLGLDMTIWSLLGLS